MSAGLTLLPLSDPPDGFNTWACHHCGAQGRGDGIAHFARHKDDLPDSRRELDLQEKVHTLTNALNYIRQRLRLHPLHDNALTIELSETALRALNKAGQDVTP